MLNIVPTIANRLVCACARACVSACVQEIPLMLEAASRPIANRQCVCVCLRVCARACVCAGGAADAGSRPHGCQSPPPGGTKRGKPPSAAAAGRGLPPIPEPRPLPLRCRHPSLALALSLLVIPPLAIPFIAACSARWSRFIRSESDRANWPRFGRAGGGRVAWRRARRRRPPRRGQAKGSRGLARGGGEGAEAEWDSVTAAVRGCGVVASRGRHHGRQVAARRPAPSW